MRVLNEQVIERFARKHADARNWLENWLRNARETDWRSIQDVHNAYPAADGGVRVNSGGTVTVFDVGGNKYRMVVSIAYPSGIVIVHEILPHADYSKDRWKERY